MLVFPRGAKVLALWAPSGHLVDGVPLAIQIITEPRMHKQIYLGPRKLVNLTHFGNKFVGYIKWESEMCIV